ncbi:MAG: hypothetical protein EXR77_19630 [Myxococcales bacterium]|nr:hypothetical protein [Myxococcales bacterium]
MAATLRTVAVVLLALSGAGCDKLPNIPWIDSADPDAAASSGHDEPAASKHRLAFLKDNVLVIVLDHNELGRRVSGEQTRVFDANERAQVAFEGCLVTGLLDSTFGPDWQRWAYVELRSIGDRSVTIATTRLLARRAWLVWGRTDRRDFVVHVAANNGRMTPVGPLYLVWESQVDNNVTDPDPWVTGIEAVNLSNVASGATAISLAKDASPAAQAGLVHFKAYCARCHAINGIGGGSGPELNAPVSVTQYWQQGWLEKFLDNPTAIRYGAANPKLPADIADRPRVIAEVVAFLREAARDRPAPTQQ